MKTEPGGARRGVPGVGPAARARASRAAAPRAPGDPGRARRGLGAARGAGLGPCAPRRPRPARKAPRPSRKPGRAPCSRPAWALRTLQSRPLRFAVEARGAGGGTSFERETCDARLTALRRTPACGQAREGVSFPPPCLCFWSRMQPGARRGPTLHSSLHFGPVRSGPAGAFAPTPCPGRLARLPLRPSRRAGSPRARGEQGAVTAHPRRCPQSGCAT